MGSELLKTPKYKRKRYFRTKKVQQFLAFGGKSPFLSKDPHNMHKNTLVLQNYTRDLGFWPDEARADAERKLKCDRPDEEQFLRETPTKCGDLRILTVH